MHQERHIDRLEEAVQQPVLVLHEAVELRTSHEAAHVETVLFLPNRVQAEEADETGDLKYKIEEKGKTGIEGKGTYGWHI